MRVIRHKSGMREMMPASKAEATRLAGQNLMPAVVELGECVRRLAAEINSPGSAVRMKGGGLLPDELIIERKARRLAAKMESFGKKTNGGKR